MKLPFWNRRRRDEELDEEIRGHLEMAARDSTRDSALREFGNVSQVKELTREMWKAASIERLLHELRITLRGLRRAPTFTVTAVMVLGLGIGMAVAMFTVFHAVLIRSLPVQEQATLILPRTVDRNGVDVGLAQKEFALLLRESRTIASVAAVWHGGAVSAISMDGDRPVWMKRARVTAHFFDVLGARPFLGRMLRPEDDASGAPPVIVITHDAWQRHFGGDSGVIGRVLTDPYYQWKTTIVGVAPRGLGYPVGVEYWTPTLADCDGCIDWDLVARLAPGATPSTAKAEFWQIMEGIDHERPWRKNAPAFPPVARAEVRTLGEAVVGDASPALRILVGAVALLLLIACVNVGNLVLLRISARRHEIAIRRSLGASATAVVRQMLMESGVLGIAGGALGVGLSWLLLRLFLMVPGILPQSDQVRVEGLPILAAMSFTAAAVILIGLAPLFTAARGDLAAPLRLGLRVGGQNVGRRRVRQWLVASQVALAIVMVSAAGLLARSLARLQGVDVGYTPRHLSVVTLATPVTIGKTSEEFGALFETAIPRLRTVPGVVAVSPIGWPPFTGTQIFAARFEAEEQVPAPQGTPSIPIEIGDVDYFKVMDIPIRRGRGFLEDDRKDSPNVAVVSEATAELFWPGTDPVGKRLRLPGDSGINSWRTVVGVAGDIHYRNLRESTRTIYLPWRQMWSGGGLTAIRSTDDIEGIVPSLRAALHDIAPQASIIRIEAMDRYLDDQRALPRFSTLLLSGFGLAALFLAAIGLYGVLSATVRERTRDLGVRAALGATPRQLLREVLAHALGLVGVGAAVGLSVTLAGSRLLGSLLFQVSPTDPVALAGACALLLGFALVAAFLPARRATMIDPAQVLRSE